MKQIGTRWLASTEQDIKSGIATFELKGKTFTLNLESFDDFLAISKMLGIAVEVGELKFRSLVNDIKIGS